MAVRTLFAARQRRGGASLRTAASHDFARGAHPQSSGAAAIRAMAGDDVIEWRVVVVCTALQVSFVLGAEDEFSREDVGRKAKAGEAVPLQLGNQNFVHVVWVPFHPGDTLSAGANTSVDVGEGEEEDEGTREAVPRIGRF